MRPTNLTAPSELYRTVLSTVSKSRATAPQAQEARKQPAFDPEAYAARLDASHASLAPLGISAETLKAWKAGYSNSGTNRGRLAIALHDRDGNILGFAGRSLGDEQPALTIPNGINPQEIIFGGDRVEQGTLYLVRDVLDVLKAHESGVTNCVCFLTDITGAASRNACRADGDQALRTSGVVLTIRWKTHRRRLLPRRRQRT